jgi:hypothetical protein
MAQYVRAWPPVTIAPLTVPCTISPIDLEAQSGDSVFGGVSIFSSCISRQAYLALLNFPSVLHLCI